MSECGRRASLFSWEQRGAPDAIDAETPHAKKIVPICGNRATQATLLKTTQRELSAFKSTYPVAGESNQGYKLGNRVQPGVTAGAGYSGQPGAARRDCWSRLAQAGDACLDAVVACGQRKLFLRI